MEDSFISSIPSNRLGRHFLLYQHQFCNCVPPLQTAPSFNGQDDICLNRTHVDAYNINALPSSLLELH
ncbi:aquaporin PIP1-3-like [Gossypium australe]|uniref:Aquaporin PIP1-3-like n=1 Tax=Gossypium australe TaxID=47621 RepID=A0A5B6TXR4_9ROSI|nr:aquaporin PIP1-3-like [Gossypium australe]